MLAFLLVAGAIALLSLGCVVGFIGSALRGGSLAFQYAEWLASAQDTETSEQQLADEAADLCAVLAVLEARDNLAAFPAGVVGGTLRERIRAVYTATDGLREQFAARLMSTSRFAESENDEQPAEADIELDELAAGA